MATVPHPSPTDKPTRAAIYVRVSTDDQADEEISLPGQIRECQTYAAQQGWVVVEVFQRACRPHRRTPRLPAHDLLCQAKARTLRRDHRLDMNRLSRNSEHRIVYQSLLRHRGIKMVSLKEPAMDGALAVLMEPILAAIDEFMAIQVAEDTLSNTC